MMSSLQQWREEGRTRNEGEGREEGSQEWRQASTVRWMEKEEGGREARTGA
jgi:hypothetical protein